MNPNYPPSDSWQCSLVWARQEDRWTGSRWSSRWYIAQWELSSSFSLFRFSLSGFYIFLYNSDFHFISFSSLFYFSQVQLPTTFVTFTFFYFFFNFVSFIILFFNFSLLQIVCLSYSLDGGINNWSMILSTLIHFSFLQTASQSDSLGPFDPGLVDCNSQQVNESVHIHSSVCLLKKNKFINPPCGQ